MNIKTNKGYSDSIMCKKLRNNLNNYLKMLNKCLKTWKVQKMQIKFIYLKLFMILSHILCLKSYILGIMKKKKCDVLYYSSSKLIIILK